MSFVSVDLKIPLEENASQTIPGSERAPSSANHGTLRVTTIFSSMSTSTQPAFRNGTRARMYSHPPRAGTAPRPYLRTEALYHELRNVFLQAQEALLGICHTCSVPRMLPTVRYLQISIRRLNLTEPGHSTLPRLGCFGFGRHTLRGGGISAGVWECPEART